ncbi:MAG: hypothetical protein NVS1B2_08870 [Vulcanimicrobiaceae bacterium]
MTARPVTPSIVFTALSLAEAQRRAVAASPDLAVATARLAQSRSALAAARSGITPSLVLTYAQVPQGNPPGPTITSRQLTTGLQLNVGDFVAYAPAVREAAYTLAASEADRGAALATERVKVVGLYFDALKARAVAAARRDALLLANAQFRAARIRARAGDAPQLDVLRADVAVAKATADVETANAADANATEALRIETAAGPGTLDATKETELPGIETQLTDPSLAIARARAMRPEIRSATLAIDAARAAVNAARALGFPTITVSGGYLVGTDSGVPINAPTLNAQVTVPFSSANRNRIAVAAAKVIESQAKAATIVVGHTPGVIVPSSAIVQDPQSGKTVVFVREAHPKAGESGFALREVAVRASDAATAAVATGQHPGERIASQGGYALLAPAGG